MTSVDSGSQQATKTCAIRGSTTSYPIELNEKFYCSSSCLREYRDDVGHHQFHRDTLATCEQKREREGIPERALSALRLNKNMTHDKLQEIIDSAERLSADNDHFGEPTRHLFITLGRAVAI